MKTNMKRIMTIAFAVIIACFSSIAVFAAGINSSEASVLSNMRTPANMKGNSVYVPASYINQAESYFNTIDMTSDQASRINSIIGQARGFLASTGKASVKELSASERKTLMNYANAAANVLRLSAAAGSDGQNIKIITKSGKPVVDDSTKVIKPTGVESSFAIYVSTLIIVTLFFGASAGIILSRKKNFTYEKTK